MPPGGSEHSHTVEHCWYILSGYGRIYQEGKVYEIGPEKQLKEKGKKAFK